MRQGDIVLIIIYKKDPKEIRNYRPITLLNRDYKILTTILAGRLKNICEAAISKQQKGFVPGRQIIDRIHQVYLIQEYVDSFDEDALSENVSPYHGHGRREYIYIFNILRYTMYLQLAGH
tara:strand:- start:20 stop:379 length:360 start_codon:yes stop_codon:yes gene_type:complete